MTAYDTEVTPTASGRSGANGLARALPAAARPARQRVEPPPPDVLLVATTGCGSLDLYSQKLAERLAVRRLETDAYRRSAEGFNVPLVSRRSLAGFAFDVRFTRLLRRLDAELLHLPNHHMGRYAIGLRTPYVVTVHDLIRYLDAQGRALYIHRPNARDRLLVRADARGIQQAAAVIAVSQTTKRDLVTHLGVDAERIFVVHEGVDHALLRPTERRLLAEPYVLFVGSEQPRKNLRRLFLAFAVLKRDRRFRALRLVKVGRAGGQEAPFRAQTLAAAAEAGIERDLVFTGRVPEADLAAYYSGAACLVLPSLYEGFGLPPIEAMACGCPVVVSTAGALPEMTDGAALAVEPTDVGALADAMRRVLVDDEVRADLHRRGLRHARAFSWERTARETTAVYRAAAALS